MSELFNIFPKRKTPLVKKEKPKQKIIVDYREQNSFIPIELKKLGYDVELKELKVADYIVNNVAIERKTVSDFISSMINKRLLRQLEELQQYKNKLIIIEGIEEQELYNEDNTSLHPNAIRGFLLSILLKHNIPIIFTKNAQDTAKFIHVIAKKQDKEMSFRANKKTLSKKEQLQYILEGFPNIGPKNAKKLLKDFKSIKKIFNATDKQLQDSIGKKSESIIKLRDAVY
jgi:Fanconi anemia group M protein